LTAGFNGLLQAEQEKNQDMCDFICVFLLIVIMAQPLLNNKKGSGFK